jgi:hypothetical protein
VAHCESTDFIYPLLADIFYPIVEQGAYGNVKKQWILDRSIACFVGPAGTAGKEEIKPNANITIDRTLIGRTKSDILSSQRDSNYSMTNVIVANIRDSHGNLIYNETAGVRSGKSTIFEIASFEPIVGPFGSTEYYKIILARSENQAADI